MTKAQRDHLQAAQNGNLWVNDRGGLIRRFVRYDGRVDRAVCERLYAAGLLRSEPQPGAAVVFRCVPTEAGGAAL